MTREEISTLLDQHAAAHARGDIDALVLQYHPAATVVSPMFGTVSGRDKIRRSFVALTDALDNWDIQLQERVIEGDSAIEIRSFTATHVAEMFGMPATHRQVSFTCALHFAFKDGAITHERRVYDFTSLLMQMGVLRAKPA
jgi:predicted ester cyclase